jgi:hypothetical protein
MDSSPLKGKYQSGEIYLKSTSGQKLPLGVFGRGVVGSL